MFDDEVDPFEVAEAAEMVRGQHFTAWRGETERLAESERWDEYERLLQEMRDATERGAQIAGYTVAPAPAMALAQLYHRQGDTARAVAELERYLTAIATYRRHEPAGGDTGQLRAIEQVRQWTGRDPALAHRPRGDEATASPPDESPRRRGFLRRLRR